MALANDLKAEVAATFRQRWIPTPARTVPEPDDVGLDSNHAKYLEAATVLYADVDGSTAMVKSLTWQMAAEVYKTYLRSASQIIRSEGGTITAYDGDRVMAIFIGKVKNTTAVRTAMKIHRAVIEIIRPEFKARYSDSSFVLKHVVGIDSGPLRAARVGVRGDNDIVWVGSAANYAAKMCAFGKHPIWITGAVHDVMNDEVKLTNGTSMWTAYPWKELGNSNIYGTNFMWHSL